MKSKIIIALSSLTLLLCCFSAPVEDINKEKVIKQVKQILTYLHFSPKEINDQFSENVYDRYIESLDPYKRIFTQEDMAVFNTHKDSLDDYFNQTDLTFYNLTVNKFYERMAENEKIINEILSKKISLDEDEYLIVDEDKKDFPTNSITKKAEWKKYLKYLILDEIQTLNEIDENKDLSNNELIVKAQKEVKDNLQDYYRRFKAKKKEDMFSSYVNAFTEEYDPHTYYFSPKNKEDFDISISGSFEGIGATLSDEKGYATIKSLVIGGPAWKSKKVFKEDKILAVAEKGEEPVNIVGMALDDAIRLIRGKKGSEIFLTLKREDGSIEIVSFKRDKIEIEESYVKSAIVKDEEGNAHGFISIPSFYIDVNDRKGRNVSDDVKTELKNLKKENVKTIILDVRNNGGGSLIEVVEIVGLFIKEGPVVQVKSSDDTQKVYSDEDESIDWSGPLVVMTNEFSASASEILAGAIKDYNRGLIVGSKQTYGKGTVQNVLSLDRFSRNRENSGDLKLTIQKFYRVNGSSTQIKGVESDIVIPDKYELAEINESYQDNAMSWDNLNPLEYSTWKQDYNLNVLKQKSTQRMTNNPFIQNIKEEAQWIKKIKEESKVALQYDAYVNELKIKEDKIEEFKKKEEFDSRLIVNYPKNELSLIEKDTIFKSKREDWHKNIKKDFYLQETIHVINDAY